MRTERRVLVAVASRHGATAEIADAIGRTLEASGVHADVLPVSEVEDLAPYDAVVLGSAVYMGRWLEPARRFAERHGPELAERRVWLFSSGPIGDPPGPAPDEAVKLGELMSATGAREHRVFTGRLDREGLGFRERVVVRALHAPGGDVRDWDEIAAWARSVAAGLAAPGVP